MPKPVARWRLSSCPKCHGSMWSVIEDRQLEWHCLQCGYLEYSQEPLLRTQGRRLNLQFSPNYYKKET